MSFDLGDVVTLTATVRDADGDLVDAGSIVCTVTLPDGTTATPTVTRDSLGTYHATYTPAAAGRFLVRWVTTGAGAAAFVDDFTVVAPGAQLTWLVTTDDVAALGVDPDLVTDGMLAQASARFRSEAGGHQITIAEYTRTFATYGGEVVLPYTPVISIDAVLALNDDGSAGGAVAGWTFDGNGVLCVSGVSGVVINAPEWDNGYPPSVQVTWTAGYATIPEDVRWAVAAMVERKATSGSPGVISEQVGDFSRSFGGYTASGAFSMSKDELAVARRYRPHRASVPLRLG